MHLVIIFQLFCSAAVAFATLRKASDKGSMMSIGDFQNLSEDRNLFQKRENEVENPQNKVKALLMQINIGLKADVTESAINYTNFEAKEDTHVTDLSLAEELMKKHLKVGHFLEELSVIKRLFDSLKNALDTRKRFEGCEYPGADLVEETMDVNVHVMALYHLENFEEPQVSDYDRQFAALDSKLKLLNGRDTSKLSSGMKKILAEQMSLARGSVELSRDLNFFETDPSKAKIEPPSSVDPGFNWYGQQALAAKKIEVEPSALRGVDSGFNWHGKFSEVASKAQALQEAIAPTARA